MPHHHRATISGTITDVFLHRFVVQSKESKFLADLGPKGLERFPLVIGDEVTLDGEIKPSELKVMSIAKKGGEPVEIDHKKPHEREDHDHHNRPAVDPTIALEGAKEAGFNPLGQPRCKPKHFEVLATKEGRSVELHIELDGRIRKEKPVHVDDPKWADERGKLSKFGSVLGLEHRSLIKRR
jgi:hypothetical protein